MLQQRCQRMLTVGQYVTRWENVLLTPNSVPLLLIPYLCLAFVNVCSGDRHVLYCTSCVGSTDTVPVTDENRRDSVTVHGFLLFCIEPETIG